MNAQYLGSVLCKVVSQNPQAVAAVTATAASVLCTTVIPVTIVGGVVGGAVYGIYKAVKGD